MKITETPPPNTPLEYFSKIQSGFGNHAQLFFIMCQLLDIPCVVVDGMTKSKVYTVGDPINQEEMAAQWNAVYIKDEWRLLDLFWARECVEVDSGNDEEYDENGDFMSVEDANSEIADTISKASFIRYHHSEEVDEQYFLTDPRQLIWTHFPFDSKWQLMKTPMSEKDWEEQLYVRERTHELELSIKRNLYGKCIVNAKDGKADIIIWFPEQRGKFYEFKHSFKRTNVSEGRRPIDRLLNRFTIFDQVHDRIHFKCMLPVSGSYYLDFYGRDKNIKDLSEFDLLCTYVIVSTTPDKEPEPLPDYPRIGWGECARSRKLKLLPITHKEAFITTEDGILDIRMQGSDKIRLKLKLKSTIADEANLVKYTMMHWHAGEYLIQTRLPKPGKYALKLYGFMEPNATEMVNVYNYMITCTGRSVKNYPFPCFAQDKLGEDPNAYKIWVRGFQTETSFIEAREGHTKLEFEAKDGVLLLTELNTNNPFAAERMRVVPKEERNHQCYYLDLPVEGEYSFNLFAYRKSNSQKIHNAFTYLVHSSGRPIEKGQAKGNTSRNFWRDCNEITTDTIETTDDEVILPVPRNLDNLIAFLSKRKSEEPPSAKSVERFTEKEIELYRVKVPDVGEYVFTIYEKKDAGFVKSRARYIIRKVVDDEDEEKDDQDFLEVLSIIRDERRKEGKSVTEADRHLNSNRKIKLEQPKVSERIALSQRLKSAINSRRPVQLRRALDEYKYLKPSQTDDLLVDGSRLLRKLEAQEGLIRAYEDQNLEDLERAIVKARTINDPSMKQPLALASRLRDRLAAKNNLRDMMLNADIRTIYELRKLVHPPDGVHQAIKAALILLDSPRQEVEDWKKCLAMLGNRSQDGLRYKMAELNPTDVSRKNALDAKVTIEPYTAEQLRYISPGAAAFYLWSDQIIKDVEANSGVLKKKPPKPKTPPPPPPREPTPPPQPKKKKEPSTKFVTLDKLMKEKFPMDPDPNAKPEKSTPTPAPEPPSNDDTSSSNSSYVTRHQQRTNYYGKKNRASRAGNFQSDSPISKTPVNSMSPDPNQKNPKKSESPDRRRPRNKPEKEPNSLRPPDDPVEKPEKTNKPKENKNVPNKSIPSKNAPSNENPIKNPRDASPGKAGGPNRDNKRNESPTRRPDKGELKRIDSRGYYKNFKAQQILNQSMEPDILQINHDTDPVEDPLEPNDPKGYNSIYQKKKHFNEFKSLPKQAV
ncbi:uncharacterized protein LOC134253171 [Saccostrea cucullata]|uniref:uncharacterized protein LOC134253171 n=1 Tax=Saccostrea cuccullata TaxID=36930 RepID=UPI002ED39DB5